MILYGIANCDSVKQARAWLTEHDLDYVFHDYKKAGIDSALLRSWVEQVGWERVLNRAGTTFRKLPETDKRELDADKAVGLMLAHPSAIKRPVVVSGDVVVVGFDPARWQAALA